MSEAAKTEEPHKPPLTIAEAAERLHMSKDSVRRLIERGLLAEIRYSPRLVLVTCASVEEFERTGDPDWKSRLKETGESSGRKKVDRSASQLARATRR